jgi:hypothetical protein
VGLRIRTTHPPPSYCSYYSYNSYCSYCSVSHTSHPQSVSLCRGANSLRPHPDGPHAFARLPSLPTPTHVFWPEASHPQSVSLCRGANSLRPHPYGPHTLLLGYHHFLRPHTLWPEAIAARWSCGPHVTPVSNRRRRCRAGVSRPTTTRALRRCAAYVATTLY